MGYSGFGMQKWIFTQKPRKLKLAFALGLASVFLILGLAFTPLQTFLFDNSAPIITLSGSQTIFVEANSIYNEPGVIVTDNKDTNLNLSISGITTSTGGFSSGIGTGVQITTVGNQIVFTVPGVGTTSLTLF
jgi:cytochrome c biogenesis protein CcdA